LQSEFRKIFLAINVKDMYLTAEKKREFFTEHGKSEFDTGSPEGQIAMFTFRIKHLTEHLKVNKKDVATERSLIKLVGKRRRLLDYLKENDIERYRSIIKTLGIRK
jgi:small subunit ribosomal protein S15